MLISKALCRNERKIIHVKNTARAILFNNYLLLSTLKKIREQNKLTILNYSYITLHESRKSINFSNITNDAQITKIIIIIKSLFC